MSPSERQTTQDQMVDGLAALTLVLAERDDEEPDVLRYLRDMSAQVGGQKPEVFRAAAAAITNMPLPPVETAEETERARPLRQMLGVPGVEDRLAAALKAREWLLRLAEDLEADRL